jgi:hypothetical protein
LPNRLTRIDVWTGSVDLRHKVGPAEESDLVGQQSNTAGKPSGARHANRDETKMGGMLPVAQTND